MADGETGGGSSVISGAVAAQLLEINPPQFRDASAAAGSRWQA
jgi:hypothetical protein